MASALPGMLQLRGWRVSGRGLPRVLAAEEKAEPGSDPISVRGVGALGLNTGSLVPMS